MYIRRQPSTISLKATLFHDSRFQAIWRKKKTLHLMLQSPVESSEKKQTLKNGCKNKNKSSTPADKIDNSTNKVSFQKLSSVPRKTGQPVRVDGNSVGVL